MVVPCYEGGVSGDDVDGGVPVEPGHEERYHAHDGGGDPDDREQFLDDDTSYNLEY